MKAWDVITHGGGEGLFYTFNAVAAFFNGNGSGNSVGSLAATLGTISTTFAAAIAIFTMVLKQDIKVSFNWLFASFLMMNLLMFPKVNILVIDRVTGFKQPVANVPFILGAFAGVTSQLGDVMAKKMDDVFSGPLGQQDKFSGKEVMNYRMHGVAMASQLVAKSSRFTVTDPDMAANLREFVQQCVMIDIAKGKYRIATLLESTDVWGLLKEKASPARGFPYRFYGKDTLESKIVTCKEGAERLDIAWSDALDKAKKIYGARFFPNSKNPGNTLIANMSISYDYLANISGEASHILRQNMMINALEDGLLSANQINDAGAAVTGYATTRAQEQQKTAYALQGNMASLSLSILKIVVEVMFYAIFPIIVIIAIFPGGIAVLKKYVIALFWIQSWAPLYSVLNMLVNIYGRSKSVAAVMGPTAVTGLSAATMPGLAEGNEWVAAVAGYTMMSVPFLSYGLIHYGAGAFSQLSTHFGSVTQSAASHAAEEATTGNYHMGNTSFDNHSKHNISGFKQDQNLSVATGKSSVQMADGSWISTTMGGNVIYDQGAGIGNFGGKMNYSGSISESLSNSADISHREGTQYSQSAQEALSSGIQQAYNYNQSRSNALSSDISHSMSESYTENKAINKLVDKVSQFAKQENISFADSNAMLTRIGVRAGVGGDLGVSTTWFKMGGSAGLDISGDSSHTSSRTGNELEEKAARFCESENMSELLQNARTEAMNNNFRNSESSGSSVSDSINASFSKADSFINSATASFGAEQQYRESAQKVASGSLGYNLDLTQEYTNHLLSHSEEGKKLGMSGVHEVLANPKLNQKYLSGFIEEQANKVHSNIWHNKISDPKELEMAYKNNSSALAGQHSTENSYKDNRRDIDHLKNKNNLSSPVVDSVQNNLANSRDSLNLDFENKRTSILKQKNESTNALEEKIKNN